MAVHADKHPDDGLLPFYRGEVYAQEGRFKLANEAFALGMAKNRFDKDIHEEFWSRRLEALHYTGQTLTAYAESGRQLEAFRQLAQLCMAADNIEMLQALVAAHAKSFPNEFETLRWDCRVKVRLGQTAQALELFKKAKEAIPPFRPNGIRPDAHPNDFNFEFISDMVDAGKFMDAYTAIQDRDEAFQVIANLLLDQGRSDALQELIKEHKRRQLGDSWLYCLQAELHAQDKAWEKAAEGFTNAWRNTPQDAKARFRWPYVLALYNNGQVVRAGEIAREEGFFYSHGMLYGQLVDLVVADKKSKELEQLVRGQREIGVMTETDADFMMARAMILQRQFKEASDVLRIVCQQQLEGPTRKQYNVKFVLDMAAAGRALEGYLAAPDKQAAFEALAKDLLDKKNDKELEKLLGERARAGLTGPWYWIYTGDLHLLRGEPQLAETSFVKAQNQSVQRDPWHWQARNGLMRAHPAWQDCIGLSGAGTGSALV